MTTLFPAPAAGWVGWMPATFVFLWATGFIGAKYGLPYAQPATFLVYRFVLVVALMLPIALALRAPWPSSRSQVVHIAIAGMLLHAGYLGGVFSSIHAGMSAGLSALIVGLQPILTALAAAPVLGETLGPPALAAAPVLGETLGPPALAGFVLAVVGVAVVVRG